MKKIHFSIIELENEAAETPVHFDEMVDVSDLAASESNDIRKIDEVQVKGFVVVEKDEFIFSFTMTGEMVLPCARTLVDVNFPIDMTSDEVFSTAFEQRDNEEEDVHHVTGDMIDLTPYIKENIILQMPYRVFSDEKGLQEGSDWNLYDEVSFERQQREKIDPRLAKLQQLIDPETDDK